MCGGIWRLTRRARRTITPRKLVAFLGSKTSSRDHEKVSAAAFRPGARRRRVKVHAIATECSVARRLFPARPTQLIEGRVSVDTGTIVPAALLCMVRIDEPLSGRRDVDGLAPVAHPLIKERIE